MDSRVASTFELLWITLWLLKSKYLFEPVLSVHLGVHPEVETAGQMVIPSLTSRGNPTLLSTPAIPFHIPTKAQRFY